MLFVLPYHYHQYQQSPSRLMAGTRCPPPRSTRFFYCCCFCWPEDRAPCPHPMHAPGTSRSAGQGCAALHAPAATASPTLKKRRSDPKVSPTAELKILSATDPNGLASTSCTHAAKSSHLAIQIDEQQLCSNISQQLYACVPRCFFCPGLSSAPTARPDRSCRSP